MLVCSKSAFAGIIIVFAVLLLSAFVLSACETHSISDTGDGKTENEIPEMQWSAISSDSAAGSISRNSVPLIIPKGWDPVGAAGNADNGVFYIRSKSIPMGLFAEKTEIMHYDIQKDSSALIFSFDERNANHWVNELVASDDALFWVYTDGVEQRIEKYDLESHAATTVKEFSPDAIILLSASGDYLTWFVGEGDGIKPYTLYAMDVHTEEIGVVSANVYPLQSPYTRAFISEGITSYLSDSANPQIVVYDLQTKTVVTTISRDTDAIIENPKANRDYLLWEERESVNSADVVYLLFDLREGKLFDAALNSISESIFSVHLLNHSIAINVLADSSSILLADINNHTVSTLMEEDAFLSWCYVIDDKSFLTIRGSDSIEIIEL